MLAGSLTGLWLEKVSLSPTTTPPPGPTCSTSRGGDAPGNHGKRLHTYTNTHTCVLTQWLPFVLKVTTSDLSPLPAAFIAKTYKKKHAQQKETFTPNYLPSFTHKFFHRVRLDGDLQILSGHHRGEWKIGDITFYLGSPFNLSFTLRYQTSIKLILTKPGVSLFSNTTIIVAITSILNGRNVIYYKSNKDFNVKTM